MKKKTRESISKTAVYLCNSIAIAIAIAIAIFNKMNIGDDSNCKKLGKRMRVSFFG